MIARLVSVFRGWTFRAKGAAFLGGIAAVAISGYAFAIAPTVDSGRNFAGAITIMRENQGTATTLPAYTVPAGSQYTLTDIIVSNPNSSYSAIQVLVGNEPCNTTVKRTHQILVPAYGSLHVPMQTGLSVAAGKTVCISIGFAMSWTLRGYLSDET